jgi:hypothetical protein
MSNTRKSRVVVVLLASIVGLFAGWWLRRPHQQPSAAPAIAEDNVAPAPRLSLPTSPEPPRAATAAPRHADTYASRPSGEWQGMPIDLTRSPPCDASEHCGLARACVNGVCTACDDDSDCTSSEGCVLGHCVQKSLMHCRSKRDCGADEMCILSGYSSDARGNESMTSVCNPSSGGKEQRELVHQEVLAAESPEVSLQSLRSGL